MFPWGEVISAGGSILGGLLGGKKSKGPSLGKQKAHALDYDRRRIRAVVDGARDAGIHPLVALGSTGGGFSPTMPVQSESPNWLSAIGPGLEALGGLYQQDADRQDEARQDQARWRSEYGAARERWRENERVNRAEASRASLDERIADAQIRLFDAQALEAEARARAVGATTMNRIGIPNAAGGSTSLRYPGGSPWPVGPGSSAQDVEDEYSDLVGNVYGAVRAGRDQYKAEIEPRLKSAYDWFVAPFRKRGWID